MLLEDVQEDTLDMHLPVSHHIIDNDILMDLDTRTSAS